MSVPMKQLDPYRWEIPKSYKAGMRVPGIIYADERLMEAIREDNCLEQVANGATFPGIVKASLAMPDIHYGYGLPIGGVVATDLREGIVSPGGTGYDINCGVRLLRTNLQREDVQGRMKDLVEGLYREIPSGVGSKGRVRLSPGDERHLLLEGARWVVKQGYGHPEDLEHMEEGGCLEAADPDAVSSKALERGRPQQGTLGSGNHFVEVQYIQEVFDEKCAEAFGLRLGQVTIMIHTGSRGFGHQVCTDFLVTMNQAMAKYDIHLPDRQLACAPLDSPEGRLYLGAMRAAANFAWANRQFITHWVEEVFLKSLRISPRELAAAVVYDVAHNIVKIEEHEMEGEKRKVAVHRKGATRAFPAGHPDVPQAYRAVGHPVLIPGDMGTNSYVLVGTPLAMAETFGSTCHGAGRVLSRHAAKRAARGRSIYRELEDQGIILRATGRDTVVEEMPEAYKDIHAVVDVVHQAGISRKVAKLRPIGVIKG